MMGCVREEMSVPRVCVWSRVYEGDKSSGEEDHRLHIFPASLFSPWKGKKEKMVLGNKNTEDFLPTWCAFFSIASQFMFFLKNVAIAENKPSFWLVEAERHLLHALNCCRYEAVFSPGADSCSVGLFSSIFSPFTHKLFTRWKKSFYLENWIITMQRSPYWYVEDWTFIITHRL